MPELPEVEVVRKSLNQKIKNKEIKKVLVRNKNLRFKVPPDFKNFLKNKKVTNVSRFSKYLILCLDKKSFCLIHLGMSGTIHLVNFKKKIYLQIQVFITLLCYLKNIIILKSFLRI